MFRIEGNYMYHPKGDTANIRVRVFNTDGTAHPYAKDDVVKLTIRSKANSTTSAETYQTTCTSTSGPEYLDIEIPASSSAGLSVGQYAADITYTSSGDVYTIFPTWGRKGDSRKMAGLDTDWANFWVMPVVRS